MGVYIPKKTVWRFRRSLVVATVLTLAAQLVYGLSPFMTASALSANVTQLRFINGGQSVHPGTRSSAFQLETQNATGDREKIDSKGKLVVASDSATGRFAATINGNFSETNSRELTWGAEDGLKSFYYQDNTPGTHTITAKLTQGGLVGELTTTQVVTIVADTIKPTVPTGGQPHNTFKITNNFDFKWHASTDTHAGQITYKFRASQDINLVGNVSDGSGAWESPEPLTKSKIHSTDSIATSDGMWYWQVKAIDAAGNSSEWSDVWHVMIDTAKPDLEVLRPADGQIFGDDQVFVVESRVSDENLSGGRYTVTINEKTHDKNVDEQPVLMSASDKESLVIGMEFNTKDFNEGAYDIQISITDRAGNSTATTRKIRVDKTAPTVSINPIDTIGGDSIIINGTAADETTLAEYHYQVLDSNGNPMGNEVGLASESINDGTLGTWTITGYPSGTYYITLWAKDQAGNISQPYETSFIIDHTEPVIDINLASSPTPTASTPILLRGNVRDSDVVSLVLLLNGEEFADLTDRIDADGNWQYQLDDGLARGKYTFSVIATDQYENVSNLNSSPTSTVGIDVGAYVPPGDGAITPNLTDGLDEPFVVPSTFGSIPSTFRDTGPPEGDVLGATDKQTPTVDQNVKSAAIAATEAGWKLFGVLWYWWLLSAVVLTTISWWGMRLVRRWGAQDLL